MTTSFRTPVYIDGLYYILSPVPVLLKSNANGQLTIVQATESIVGAVITASVAGSSAIVDPMHDSYAKLAVLSDKDTLRKADFTSNAVAGGYHRR